ncbi:MAG: hypothetical protein K0Q95_3035 [Bacteroidota bacterium]|jgi:tetratricopeptide (TPR) repeat protein|nr:hypothetical protein [Bacteroidota bacterium]
MNLNDRIYKIETSLLGQYEKLLNKKLDKAIEIGNYTQMMIFSNELIEINSGNAKYYFTRGVGYYNLKHIDEAISDFKTCLYLASEQFPEAKHYLEVCNFNMKEFEESLKNNCKKEYI